jgi:hypothetical protein
MYCKWNNGRKLVMDRELKQLPHSLAGANIAALKMPGNLVILDSNLAYWSIACR